MKRFLIALMAGAMVFAVAFAAAATLSVNGGTLQYGEDNSLTCTDSANVLGWGAELDDGLTYNVRIEYDVACEGNDMFVRITDVNGGALAVVKKQPLDATGEVTLSFVTPLATTAIHDIHILIEGPG